MKNLKTFATCVAIAASSFMNVSWASNNHEFVYNDTNNEKGQLESRMVYKQSDNSLQQFRELKFTYDDEGRVLTKETLEWDAASNEWKKHELLMFDYSGETPIITRSVWNGYKYVKK